MFEYETLWDIYEVKFVIFFISVCVAIALATRLYDHHKKKNDDESQS